MVIHGVAGINLYTNKNISVDKKGRYLYSQRLPDNEWRFKTFLLSFPYKCLHSMLLVTDLPCFRLNSKIEDSTQMHTMVKKNRSLKCELLLFSFKEESGSFFTSPSFWLYCNIYFFYFGTHFTVYLKYLFQGCL